MNKEEIILKLKHLLIDLESNKDKYDMNYQVKEIIEDLEKYFKLNESIF